MNKEFKRNILREINNNRVVPVTDTDIHYAYELRGRKNRLLMRIDFYDGELPRAEIKINGEHVGHINHFARTQEQFQDNYDIWHIANKMITKYRKQEGFIETTMNDKEFRLSNFLHEFSLKRR